MPCKWNVATEDSLFYPVNMSDATIIMSPFMCIEWSRKKKITFKVALICSVAYTYICVHLYHQHHHHQIYMRIYIYIIFGGHSLGNVNRRPHTFWAQRIKSYFTTFCNSLKVSRCCCCSILCCITYIIHLHTPFGNCWIEDACSKT